MSTQQRVIDAAIQTVSLAAHAKNISLVRSFDDGPSALWADADRLQQIICNLLSNAIKFSPPRTNVGVACRQRDGSVEIEVSDQGQGIDPEFLPHIFERFRQADMANTRRHDGLGLGLSIVKNLVELHGGTIRAHSSGQNQGTTMTVRLPVVKEAAAIQRPVLHHGGELLGIRVLVVDDDAATCEMIARLLRDRRSEVLAVTSVDQALEELERFQPDVIVSDIAMPQRDGYELLRQVRRRRGSAQRTIRALALTALSTPDDQRRAFDAGYRMHLTKPVDAAFLAEAVAELAAS